MKAIVVVNVCLSISCSNSLISSQPYRGLRSGSSIIRQALVPCAVQQVSRNCHLRYITSGTAPAKDLLTSKQAEARSLMLTIVCEASAKNRPARVANSCEVMSCGPGEVVFDLAPTSDGKSRARRAKRKLHLDARHWAAQLGQITRNGDGYRPRIQTAEPRCGTPCDAPQEDRAGVGELKSINEDRSG